MKTGLRSVLMLEVRILGHMPKILGKSFWRMPLDSRKEMMEWMDSRVAACREGFWDLSKEENKNRGTTNNYTVGVLKSENKTQTHSHLGVLHPIYFPLLEALSQLQNSSSLPALSLCLWLQAPLGRIPLINPPDPNPHIDQLKPPISKPGSGFTVRVTTSPSTESPPQTKPNSPQNSFPPKYCSAGSCCHFMRVICLSNTGMSVPFPARLDSATFPITPCSSPPLHQNRTTLLRNKEREAKKIKKGTGFCYGRAHCA
jgi:hypothetical protein